MGVDLAGTGRSLLATAREADSVAAFGAELSRLVAPWVPHDAYLLTGQDPIAGTGCLRITDHAFRAETTFRLNQIVVSLRESAPPAERDRVPGWQRRVHACLAREGFRHELIIQLAAGGRTLGALTLLRGAGREFGPRESARTEVLAAPLAGALRRFVAGASLRPAHHARTPGVVVFGADYALLGITPAARSMLRAFWPNERQVDDDRLVRTAWAVAPLAHRTGGPALGRLPTPDGWLAMHAEPIAVHGRDAVAVTVEPARGEVLLPMLAAWYGASPAELRVLRAAAAGLAAKQIARRVDLSVHTVNDHLRALYRKTGTTGREELLARLG